MGNHTRVRIPPSPPCNIKSDRCNLRPSYVECYDPVLLYKKIAVDPECILYYTGAGISKRSGILTMPELEFELKISRPLELIEYLEKNPEFPLKVIREFYNSIKKARPNIDHFLIRNIIKTFGGDLVTENVDILHELSGVRPIKPLKGELPPKFNYRAVVILGACTLQCQQLINDLSQYSDEINLISYNVLKNDKLKYFYYNMDVHDFIAGLYKYLNQV